MNKINVTLLCLAVAVCVINSCGANPLMKQEDADTVEKCKDLCRHCGCVGFYCGDECICECNNQENENMNCVETMQSNCQKLKLPFEVLIQGPSANRFVRSLITADTTSQPEIDSIDAKARTTISIYKPDESKAEVASVDQLEVQPAELTKLEQATTSEGGMIVSMMASTTDALESEPTEATNAVLLIATGAADEHTAQNKREIAYELVDLREREFMKRDTEADSTKDIADLVSEPFAPAGDAAAIDENVAVPTDVAPPVPAAVDPSSSGTPSASLPVAPASSVATTTPPSVGAALPLLPLPLPLPGLLALKIPQILTAPLALLGIGPALGLKKIELDVLKNNFKLQKLANKAALLAPIGLLGAANPSENPVVAPAVAPATIPASGALIAGNAAIKKLAADAKARNAAIITNINALLAKAAVVPAAIAPAAVAPAAIAPAVAASTS